MGPSATSYALRFSRIVLLGVLLGSVAALAGSDEVAPRSDHRTIVSHAGGHFGSKQAPRFRRVVASGRGTQRRSSTVPDDGEPDDVVSDLASDTDDDAGSGTQQGDGTSNDDNDDNPDDDNPDAFSGDAVGTDIPVQAVVGTVQEEQEGNDELEANFKKMQEMTKLVQDADDDSFRAIDAARTWREQSAAALNQFPKIELSTEELRQRMRAGNERLKQDVMGDPSLHSVLMKASGRDLPNNHVSDMGGVADASEDDGDVDAPSDNNAQGNFSAMPDSNTNTSSVVDGLP